jgi:hypothetical protein
VEDPENFQFIVRCGACGFLNVIEQSLNPLPIAQAIKCLSQRCQDEISAYLTDTLKPSHMRAIVTAIVREVDDWVCQDLSAAHAAFTLMLRERENALVSILENHAESGNPNQNYHSKIVTRVSDLLYLLLSRHGCIHLPDNWEVAHEKGVPFLRRFFQTASDAATIALYASAIEEGQWKLVSRGDALFIESTELYSRSLEWELNRREFEDSLVRQKRIVDIDAALTKETLEAQRLVFGFDSTNIIELVQKDFEVLENSGAVRTIVDTFSLIEVERLDEYQQRVLSTLVLTLSRVLQFISPYYFDLGIIRKQNLDEIAAISHAVSANWTNYYPLYQVMNSGQQCWVASSTPILMSLTNLITFKNGLFQRIIDLRGKGLEISKKKALARLDKSRQRRLEDAVAEATKNAAWNTLGRIKKWNRSDLPFGDIDLLAAKAMPSDAFVLLAEIKDFDLPMLVKRGALERLHGQIQYAADQLQKRVEWIETAWKNGLKEAMVGGTDFDRVFLVPVVITERYLPPFVFNRFMGIPFGGLPIFLNEIVNGGLPKYQAVSCGTIVLLPS